MSAPHPQGIGAQLAMRQALQLAGLHTEQVDYISLHATATLQNDLSEARAIHAVFGSETPCSGIKGLLGHTLGASGAVEIIASLLALEHGFLPGTCGLQTRDPACQINVIKQTLNQQARYIISNAFGFGGNNASVLLAQR
jgi:3-oxoacyl-[acyl-carrier-protein] synthase-1